MNHLVDVVCRRKDGSTITHHCLCVATNEETALLDVIDHAVITFTNRIGDPAELDEILRVRPAERRFDH